MTRRSLFRVLVGLGVVGPLSGCEAIQNFGKKPTSTASGRTTSASPSPAPSPTPAPFDANTFLSLSPLAADARVPVIMYHDIVTERGRNSVWFDCTKDEFAEQIAFLEEQGASFISLEQLHRHLVNGESVPPNAVVLTFDDNYQGFYDNAYPLLKEKNIPSAVFVHTNFVGEKKSTHPKMDWDTLRQLDGEKLVTIGSHTLSHPEDMAKQPIEEQIRELTESKTILENELGHSVPYFAYPNGTGDQATFDAVEQAGYTMAFTIVNGPAEESPGILRVNRYIHTRLPKAWEECQQAAINAPATIFQAEITPTPVTLQVQEFDGIKLGVVRGGKPSTWRTAEGRNSVGEFIQIATQNGTLSEPICAGMNGTFFADAYLRGTDNTMIGPCRTQADGIFYPEEDSYRLPRLKNRPLVLMGPTQIMILPFHAATMNEDTLLTTVLPDVTDVFLAGAWIVHNGEARTKEEMQAYSARDFNDPRRRACFGISDSGEVLLIGSLEVITTEMLARAAVAAGAKEAVLMDSGFSTSIVFDDKIIVTGHTAKHLPSRPVPHAILVTGQKERPTDPETLKVLENAEPAVDAKSERNKKS